MVYVDAPLEGVKLFLYQFNIQSTLNNTRPIGTQMITMNTRDYRSKIRCLLKCVSIVLMIIMSE